MCRSCGRESCARAATSAEATAGNRGETKGMSIGTLAARRGIGVARTDHRGAAAWLLLGPCLLYLAAFAIYPLIYSLRLSFTDLTAADGTGRWVGLKNYGDLLVDPLFWNAAENSVIMVTAAVSLQ